jgi:hypothetical protein
MDNEGEAAAIKTPMIYICGECHRWVSLQNVEVRLICRSRFVATCSFFIDSTAPPCRASDPLGN